MKIVHIASECAPFSQTGGLGQVVGALPDALVRAGGGGHQVYVVTPLYRGIADTWDLEDTGIAVRVDIGGRPQRVDLRVLSRPGAATVCFADCPAMFDRDQLYDYDDDVYRFGVLCRAAVEAAADLVGGTPDVLHAHDWQAGLVPTYLRETRPDAASVFTIHNLRFQGVFHKHALPHLGLPWSVFTLDRLEYFDRLSTLKGGIADAGAVTTVSPQYAREIQTEGFGCGLHAFLAHHAGKLSGVLNGIDMAAWNPADDPAIAAPYSAEDIEGKRACRQALLDLAGLEAADDDPVLGVVSRLDEQKGLELVADLAPELAELGVRMVVLGSGEASLEDRFRRLAQRHPDRLHVHIGYDVDLAHQIYAGADMMAMPSRFEPCGLNQLYAMRYGALPIVHSVGGLRDTVTDWGNDELARGHGTGFRFDHPDTAGLRWAVGRAVALFRGDRRGWDTAVRHVMRRDLSWDLSAAEYLALYRLLRG